MGSALPVVQPIKRLKNKNIIFKVFMFRFNLEFCV